MLFWCPLAIYIKQVCLNVDYLTDFTVMDSYGDARGTPFLSMIN